MFFWGKHLTIIGFEYLGAFAWLSCHTCFALQDTFHPSAFLGYPATQKVAICFDLFARKMIVSRRVRFVENRLGFSYFSSSGSLTAPLKGEVWTGYDEGQPVHMGLPHFLTSDSPATSTLPEDLVEKIDYIVPLSSPMRRPLLTDSRRLSTGPCFRDRWGKR